MSAWLVDASLRGTASAALQGRCVAALCRWFLVVLLAGSWCAWAEAQTRRWDPLAKDGVHDPTNPGLSRRDMDQVFGRYFGARNVLWFGKGIAGDDTHGHVDDLCRFVNRNTLVLVREDNPQDANHRPLAENWERVRDFRLEDGSRPEVVSLPMPAPVVFDGQRLPASYANFYICNAAVLVPTFNDPRDREALGILADLITDRPVIGIHALDLVWGLGTIHCLTREEPAVLPRGR